MHIGAPNSGKTHDALEALKAAGSGWYLAPLRLLAYEIFDRLNGDGVACSLLTGEEYIPVEGARITAATIEMFNANESGACVIVDEAQMLADADRGWAWTRALMESAAPEMHVIGPPTARRLIEVLAERPRFLVSWSSMSGWRRSPWPSATSRWSRCRRQRSSWPSRGGRCWTSR